MNIDTCAGCESDAIEVLKTIASLLPDLELHGYEPGHEQWFAIKAHVAEVVRIKTKLLARNIELERRLLDVVRITQGIRIEGEGK